MECRKLERCGKFPSVHMNRGGVVAVVVVSVRYTRGGSHIDVHIVFAVWVVGDRVHESTLLDIYRTYHTHLCACRHTEKLQLASVDRQTKRKHTTRIQ